MTRRLFFGRVGAGLAAAAVVPFPAVVSERAPNSRLNVAAIGVGGRGGSNLKSVSGEHIVAVCDVDERHLRRAMSEHPGARGYRDFRALLAQLEDVDAVVVSTTEHTHAFATLPALRAGKHVYCEKPLTRDVREARLVTEAARVAGVATQMGTQIHAGDNYRRVVELIRGGAIGAVREVHVWVSRAWGRQSEEDAKRHRDIVWSHERPPGSTPVPEHLDWDLWLGPAPYRPFHEIYFPGPKWYRWWDFGNGTMSDLGSHWIDLAFWALDLDAPRKVSASGPPPHPEIAPASMSVRYEYAARGSRPAVEVHWYQGEAKPEIWKAGGIPQWGNGHLFVGDGGMLLSDYGKHVLLPEERYRDFERPAPTIPASIGHHAEWLEACRTGGPTTCHFGYAGPLTEANHLGNVAYRAGVAIEWDASAMRIPNAPAAERFLGREYRDGWTL